MFTLEQIEIAHSKVKSGAEFPQYIQDIKELGVTAFETWVMDSHTEYFGKGDFQIKSLPKYEEIKVAHNCDKDKFIAYLKIHQKGETDYFTFCQHCAETGIEKEYICQLLSPLRKVECKSIVKYSKFEILPLTEKDGEGQKIKISHGGKFDDVYKRCCHSLSVKPGDPYEDFKIQDGRTLSQIIA